MFASSAILGKQDTQHRYIQHLCFLSAQKPAREEPKMPNCLWA